MMDPSQAFRTAALAHIGLLLQRGQYGAALSMSWCVAVITVAAWFAGDRIDVRNDLVRGARMLARQDADVQKVIASKDAEIASLRRRVAALKD